MRPRFVLSCCTDDKYGLAFCCGAIVALRDLGMLPLVKVIAGSGQACLLLLWLQRLLQNQRQDSSDFSAWMSALTDNLHASDPMSWMIHQTRRWCSAPHEWILFKRRCRPMNWTRFMDAWEEELACLLEEQYSVDSVMKEETCTNEPVFLYASSSVQGSKSVYVCSQPTGVATPLLNMVSIPAKYVLHPSRYLASAVCPFKRFGDASGIPLALHADRACSVTDVIPKGAEIPRHWMVSNGLAVDPLNYGCCGTYFMKERLDRAPHSDELKSEVKEEENETDTCEKLIMIDAFSNSLSFFTDGRFSSQVRHSSLSTHYDLAAAEDIRKEKLLGVRKTSVIMYPGEKGAFLDEHEDSYRQFAQSLKRHMVSMNINQASLTKADATWVMRCIHAGYLKTFEAYSFQPPSHTILSESKDPWKLCRFFFPRRS